MEKLNEILLKSGVITLSALYGALIDTTILFICVFSFVLIDNVLALYIILTQKEKIKFEWNKVKKTIEKTALYIIIAGGGVMLWVLTEIKFYIFFAIYIGIYEFFSILRHFFKITGQKIWLDLAEYIKNKIDFVKFLKK